MGLGVLAYHFEAMEYLYDINNYVSRMSLGNRLPFELFWGETPDISMIRFKFWETVYYRNWTNKAGKVLMHPRRCVGFAWNIGDPLNFKVLQCNEYPHNRNIVVHIGVVFPRSRTSIGCNSSLAPNSDAYLPIVQVEGGSTRKTAPL